MGRGSLGNERERQQGYEEEGEGKMEEQARRLKDAAGWILGIDYWSKKWWVEDSG